MNLERLENVLANIEDMVEPDENLLIRMDDDNCFHSIFAVQFVYCEKVLLTTNLISNTFGCFKAVVDSFINVVSANNF